MLKAIRIKNYRIFKGQHTIHLKEIRESPITIVSTLSGSGKTTLAAAITWCLTGEEKLVDRSDTRIFNVECYKEMAEGATETIEVELIVEIESKIDSFKRVAFFQKSNSTLVKICEHVKIPKISIDRRTADYLVDLMILGDSLYVNKCIPKKLLQLLMRNARLDPALEQLLEQTAERATGIFSNLYFRQGGYQIKWADGFVLHCSDSNTYLDDLSATDQLVFNLSVVIAMREELIDQDSIFYYLPIVIDDIFAQVSGEQFSLEKLLKVLPQQQILLLAHECTLQRLNTDRCKVTPSYYMVRCGGTSVHVEEVAT